MMSEDVTISPGPADLRRQTPDWMARLRLACPLCGSPMEQREGDNAPHCTRCTFQATCVEGILGFLPSEEMGHWQRFYDAKATGEGADSTRGVGYQYPLQHRYIVEGFRRLLHERPIGQAVLDVGCGNGLFWQALLNGRPAVGIDISVAMCALARTRGMQVYQADATALPFADEQFDLIYSAEIVQCIPDLPGLLREVARVCRPGGRVIVSTLNQKSVVRNTLLWAWRTFRERWEPGVAVPERRKASDIAALAETRSLTLTQVCWTHFPAPWLHSATTTRYALEPLATNVILEFAKPLRSTQTD